MCGRFACTLAPNQLCQACQYKAANGKLHDATWFNGPGGGETEGKTYRPNYNAAPTQYCAVLIDARHLEGLEHDLGKLSADDRILMPMRWTLVPSWHKKEPEEFQYKMVNARVEGINEKASFKNPMKKGQRCVIAVDGFYEWKKPSKGPKEPYFIFNKHGSKKIDWKHPEA